jgi:UDP-3-O-[3-hydroxymyristoyl] glucosamine N-acyltransferase
MVNHGVMVNRDAMVNHGVMINRSTTIHCGVIINLKIFINQFIGLCLVPLRSS